MPEAKNTFLKAKMNQDLDDRLLPNGEYRSAQNILVGKSEEDSVGTLENIKGNVIIPSTDLYGEYDPTPMVIGYYMDTTNDRIYTFVTNHYGSGPAAEDAHCSIRYLNVADGSYNILVQGSFLNFSTQNNIVGVNLLENLLFWTDNRNQPRKINVDTARQNPNHYYKENHISVAKYNPYESISLIEEEVEEITNTPVSPGNTFEVAENSNIVVGMTVLSESISPTDYVTVTSVSTVSPVTTVTVSDNVTIAQGDKIFFLKSTMSDQSQVSTWPGDPDYLENKFVRFAYRFKFEDNEYSIFSPFTQIAFIPKQNGYFLNGQEDKAVKSTILEWFENGINNIDLIIPLPDTGSKVADSYKIKEINVLYKESDQLAVKVIDTIAVSELANTEDNFYIYSYQSRKPIKTIAQDQTTRVYDKVPVKALAQEVVGNRVIYGNFQTKHTPPSSIEYVVNVQRKLASENYPSFIEYPNHTIKQNRNYQVGFVLSDKFGRQSDVILSPVSASTRDIAGQFYFGSTIYAEYIQDDPEGSKIVDPSYMPDGVIDWFGNSLVMAVNSPISSTAGVDGAPGLYAEENSRFDLVPQEINGVPTNVEASFSYNGTLDEWEYTFEVYETTCDASFSSNTDIPQEGDYLRAAHIDYTKVESIIDNGATTYGHSYTVRTKEKLNDLYLSSEDSVCTNISPASYIADTKFTYNINAVGWYSYKIVVKQVEQEYYNVYLPSAVSGGGLIPNSTDTDEAVSYIALINDNINKVPRDLAEVGPDQKQYRSSVKLYPRVQPNGSAATTFGNEQVYPLRSSDVSTSVGNTDDLLNTIATGDDVIFQYDSNPIVARVATENKFGINQSDFGTTKPVDRFQLAVYETDPTISNIDIYWETASAGLISDLNWDINTGFDGPVGFEDIDFVFEEQDPINTVLTQEFYPLNNQGQQMVNTSFDSWVVTNGQGVSVANEFAINQVTSGPNTGAYYITNVSEFTYIYDSFEDDVYTFEITIRQDGTEWETATLSFQGSLTNNTPNYDLPSPPYYYFNDTFTAGQLIHNFNTNNIQNGSIANVTSGLKWEIVSGNSAGYFAWDNDTSATYSTTGRLTLTTAGLNAPIGSYPLDIKLTDATSSGSEDPDSLSVTKTPIIVKGWPRSSAGEGQGDYQDGFVDVGENIEWVFAYYASDSTLNASDMPSVSFGYYSFASSQPSPPSVPYTPKTDFDNVPEKIGNTLTEGELVFEIDQMVGHDPMAILGPTPVTADFQIDVYHRATPTDSWAIISDVNNNSGLKKFTFTNTWDPVLQDNRRYDSLTSLGYGSTGEYAFIVRVSGSRASGGSEDPFYWTMNPYLGDLHYYGYGQVQNVYEYDLYTINGNGSTSTTFVRDSSLPAGPVHTVYSEVPFGEYIRVFYTDSSLINVYNTTSTPAIGTADRYYPFKLAGSDSRELYASTFSTVTENLWTQAKLGSDGSKDETGATSARSTPTGFSWNSGYGPYGYYF